MARFFTVDVFADRPYTGNPLAIVLDADQLSTAAMQAIAAEINYSETTFVMSAPEPDGAWRVRMFTPAREIAFGGHPILGTAWIVRRQLAPDAPGPARLTLPVGHVPVEFESSADGEVVWLSAPPVSLDTTCAREPIAAALGIAASDIETKAPVQQRSAGVSSLIVPVRTLDALRRCRLDLAAFAPLAAQGFASLVYVFCTETHHPENDLCARFFFDAHGVREDPATATRRRFSATICSRIDSSPAPSSRCASSRATKSVGRRSCCCAPAQRRQACGQRWRRGDSDRRGSTTLNTWPSARRGSHAGSNGRSLT
jgi:trans-2,3-dihydro-3-hydroxyanthranilate isomerase